MIKKHKILVAIIIAIIMTLTSICLPVIAEEQLISLSQNVSSEGDLKLITVDEKIASVLQNSEIVELREENVKHFALENGKYQAVVYAEAVHRKDEYGIWQDIDNRLYIKNKNGVPVYGTEDGRISFANVLNDITAHPPFFSPSAQAPSDISQLYVMSLSENGYSIEVSLVSNIVTQSVANVSNHNSMDLLQLQTEAIDNKTSLIYSNVWQNTDLEYLLVSNDIKENIIVKAPCEEYSYSFILTFDGLIPELNAAGVIMLKDVITEETMYYMPAPYMYDAKGKTSYAVDYSLVGTEDGNYILTVTADTKWINDHERTFPVIIDPTIKTTSLVYDTHICSTVPNANYGFDEDILISSMQTAFISINMPTLPTNAEILYAGLCVHYYLVGSGEYANLNVKRVLQPWTEGNLTYSTFSNSMVSALTASQITVHKANGLSDSELGIASIDLTGIAIDWYEGASNYGVAISYSSGNAYPFVLKSYESGATVRPYYIITYSTTNYGVIPNVVNLNVFYDNAYLSRYSSAASRIKNQLQVLQELYYNEFDILINYSYPQKYNSYADVSCSTNPNNSCSHVTDTYCHDSTIYVSGAVELENYHHKNIINIIARMNFPKIESGLKMTYIGHLTCSVYRNSAGGFISHANGDTLGLTFREIGVCNVMNFNSANDETKTMVHEFGHLYDAPDHYGIGSVPTTQEKIDITGDNRFSEYCIYGEEKSNSDVVENLIICNGCKAIITANRNRFNH